jgi:hypothetical protein
MTFKDSFFGQVGGSISSPWYKLFTSHIKSRGGQPFWLKDKISTKRTLKKRGAIK